MSERRQHNRLSGDLEIDRGGYHKGDGWFNSGMGVAELTGLSDGWTAQMSIVTIQRMGERVEQHRPGEEKRNIDRCLPHDVGSDTLGALLFLPIWKVF